MFEDYATLIPASALAGIGRGLFWVCVGPILYHYAAEFEQSGSRDIVSYFSNINGYFFAGFLFTHVRFRLVNLHNFFKAKFFL